MRTLVLVAAIGLVASIAGCGGQLACPGDIPGTRCETVTSVYEQEMGVKPAAKEEEGETNGETKAKSTPKQQLVQPPFYSVSPLIEKLQTGPVVDSVLLAPRQIMRVWIAPWESAGGDLHGGEFVFFETTPRRGRWSIGEKEIGQGGVKYSDNLLKLTAPALSKDAGKGAFPNLLIPGPGGK